MNIYVIEWITSDSYEATADMANNLRHLFNELKMAFI